MISILQHPGIMGSVGAKLHFAHHNLYFTGVFVDDTIRQNRDESEG